MPEERSACPDPARLRGFHAGQLTGQVARSVAKHAEGCNACRTELAELALDDRYTGHLRNLLPAGAPGADSAPGEKEPDPEYEALVSLLRETAEGEHYEVLGELGHGGMAVVYEVHDRVLQRDLAMKVARADGRSSSDAASPTGRRLARFLEEARITGQLDHPSIIPVYELGVDAQGRAFFTMSKVRGRDLREVFEEYERGEGDWTLLRLVGLLERACDALAYAHSKRVVHRDLKPANIMVGRFGVVYVMDWGLAKVVTEDQDHPRDEADEDESAVWSSRELLGTENESTSSQLTLEGEILGTPAYMPPEQSLGGADDVDLRADVYSMGAILYQLLSKRRPYDDGVEPVSPRATWSRLCEGPPALLTEVAPAAPPELVAVCERAMARDPAARYPDMVGLTADLRAWLEGRVVRAHRTGVVVEVRKWVGRNRPLAGATLLVLLVLAVVPALIVQHSVVEARSRDKVARAASTLTAHRLLDQEPAAALNLAIEISEGEQNFLSRTTLLAALQPLAERALLYGRLPRRSTWERESVHRAWGPNGDLFVFGHRELEDGPIAIRVWDVKQGRFTPEAFEGSSSENHIVFCPKGRMIASGGTDGSLSLHDRATGASAVLGKGRAHADAVARLAFDPHGKLLASASWDGSVGLWDVATGELLQTLEGHTGIVTAVEFDATGERLLSASGPPTSGYESDHSARIWNVADGECRLVFDHHDAPITSVHFQPGGNLVLSTSEDHTAQLWDPGDPEVRDEIPLGGRGWDGAFSPDGRTLAVGFDSGFLVQTLEPGGVPQRFGPYEAHDGRAVTDVEFSPEMERLRLLTVGLDHVGRVWDLDSGGRLQLALRLRGQCSNARFGSWSPDPGGSLIATSDARGTFLWFAEGNPTTDSVRPGESTPTRARFHPLGDRVLLTLEGRPAYEYVFTPGGGLQSPPSTLGDTPARDVATSADGTWTIVAEESGRLTLWSRDGNGASRQDRVLELDAETLHPSAANDLVGAILVGGGAVVVDCTDELEPITTFLVGETVNTIEFSEDGQRVALGTAQGRLLVVDRAAKGIARLDEQLDPHSLDPTKTGVFHACFYDSGRHLVTAGPQAGVKVWDVETGNGVDHLWPGATMGGVFVLRGGRRLLGLDQWQGNVSLTESWREAEKNFLRLAPGGGSHRNRISAWSLDEMQQRLLTTSLDHRATVWDLELGVPWATFAGHEFPVLAGDLSRDGDWAVTADASGRVYVWPTDPLRWAKGARPVDSRGAPR